MIYELSRSVEALMRERNFPVQVVFGPERDKRPLGQTGVIIVEDNDDGLDDFTAPQGAQRNPRKIAMWALSAKATIYARSSLPGAHLGDHRRELMRYVQGFIAAVDRWTTAERCSAQFSGGGMLKREEYGEGFEQYPGAAYVFLFRLPIGVFDFVYTPEADHTPGDAQPTGSPATVTNTLVVVNDVLP